MATFGHLQTSQTYTFGQLMETTAIIELCTVACASLQVRVQSFMAVT